MARTSRFIWALAILIAATAAPAMAQNKPGASGGSDPVTEFSATDATMNAAIDTALATLPLFLEHGFGPDGTGLSGTMLKISLPARGGGAEIIWVDTLQRQGSGFGGRLANRPFDLGPLQQGDYVEFTMDEIRDWGLRAPSGRLFGHYTTRVIAGLPGNDHIWASLEPDPIPAVWQ